MINTISMLNCGNDYIQRVNSNIRRLFLLVLLLSAHNAFAQLQGQARIDSLLKDLSAQKNEINKANDLIALAYDYVTVNPDLGLKYAQQAVTLATKLGIDSTIGKAITQMGSNYYMKSDQIKALECFDKALKIHTKIRNKQGIASATSNIGLVYQSRGEFPKALDCYLKVLNICEEANNKRGVAIATANVGNIYTLLKKNDEALPFLLKSLKAFEELNNQPSIARLTCNIASVYNDKKDYTLSLEYLFKGLKIAEEMGDNHTIVVIDANIAKNYQGLKDYQLAIRYYRKALDVATAIGYKELQADVLSFVGSLCIEVIENDAPVTVSTNRETGVVSKNKVETLITNYLANSSNTGNRVALIHEGIDYLEKAIAMQKEASALDKMLFAYQTLGVAYTHIGDYKKALEASGNHWAIKDSLYSKENNEKIVRLSVQNEYDRQRLADSLKTAQKEKISAIQLQKQKTFTYMGIAGILLLAAFSFFIVKERGKSEQERKKSDNLLLNILPVEVAAELKVKGSTTAKQFDYVTVLFTDFVNFTQAGERMAPQELINELHTCFRAFDEITQKYDIEKIKTIGDAYLAVAGLPSPDANHAENVVKAALEISTFMRDRYAKLGDKTFAIRIGINSGSVVAGIVGVKKFAYDIWGDTVNTAARMEQSGEAGKVNISGATYELVKDKFRVTYRGKIAAKGKGEVDMYFVDGMV